MWRKLRTGLYRRRPLRIACCLLWIVAVVFVGLPIFINYLDSFDVKPTAQKFQLNSDSGFQPIEGDAHVYSAYIDDRKAPDVLDEWLPVVRIVVYHERTTNVVGFWYCMFHAKQGNYTEQLFTSAVGEINMNPYDTTSKYLSAMVLCKLPASSGTPHAVSLLSPSAVDSNPVRMQQMSSLPRNTVLLIDLRSRKKQTGNVLGANYASFNSDFIRPESVDKNSDFMRYEVNYTVCVHSPLHNKNEVNEFVEFISVNQVLGAEKFIVYVFSIGEQLRRCLEAYSNVGIVEILPFVPPAYETLHYYGQIIAMNDCLLRSMYATRYLITVDLDEFVVPVSESSWSAMLRSVDQQAEDEGQAANAIVTYTFRHQFMPQHLAGIEDTCGTGDNLTHGLKTLSTFATTLFMQSSSERTKVMVRPEMTVLLCVHSVRAEDLVRNDTVIYNVPRQHAVLQHYRDLNVGSRYAAIHRFLHRHVAKLSFYFRNLGVCNLYADIVGQFSQGCKVCTC